MVLFWKVVVRYAEMYVCCTPYKGVVEGVDRGLWVVCLRVEAWFIPCYRHHLAVNITTYHLLPSMISLMLWWRSVDVKLRRIGSCLKRKLCLGVLVSALLILAHAGRLTVIVYNGRNPH